jgi:hypothetical protein
MPRRILWGLALSLSLGILMIGNVTSPAIGAGRTPRATVNRTGNLTATAGSALGGVSVTATAGGAINSVSATATALAGKNTSVSSQDAAVAIQSYATQVLGINVIVKTAGGLSGSVSQSLSQTSASSEAQLTAVDLAINTYGAVLSNGAASLSYGTGTLSGDVTIDVQGSSLGVYSLVVKGSTANADAAFALAKQTFPGVAGYSYQPYTVGTGYAWYATGYANAIDPATKKAITTAEAVILYVVPGKKGSLSVTATIGRGDFATAIKIP